MQRSPNARHRRPNARSITGGYKPYPFVKRDQLDLEAARAASQRYFASDADNAEKLRAMADLVAAMGPAAGGVGTRMIMERLCGLLRDLAAGNRKDPLLPKPNRAWNASKPSILLTAERHLLRTVLFRVDEMGETLEAAAAFVVPRIEAMLNHNGLSLRGALRQYGVQTPGAAAPDQRQRPSGWSDSDTDDLIRRVVDWIIDGRRDLTDDHAIMSVEEALFIGPVERARMLPEYYLYTQYAYHEEATLLAFREAHRPLSTEDEW